MRRRLVLIALLTGCSFDGARVGTGVEKLDAAGDARVVDASIDAPGSAALRNCPNAGTLMACYLFDGDANDGSANGNDFDLEQNISYVDGVQGMAVHFDANDALSIGLADASLETSGSLTIEVYVRLIGVPNDQSVDERVGVVDKNSDWSMFIGNDLSLQCGGSGGLSSLADRVPVNEWVHLACAHNEAEGWSIHVNAVMTDEEVAGGGPIARGGNFEFDVGSDAPFTLDDGQLVGDLDNLLIWRAKRTEADLRKTSGIAAP